MPALRRLDESPDPLFYAHPRLVTHIDDRAIAAVTDLYRRYLPAGGRVLDLMSSWVSHLPPEVQYSHVAAVGLNAVELGANPRLDEWAVHDLNADPRVPLPDASFDAAVCCVSVDYLARPVAVLRDLGRVVRPGGVFVATFSNRCFPTKVAGDWLDRDDAGRRSLVVGYLRGAGNWADVEAFDCSPPGRGDPLSAVVGRSTGPAADARPA